METIYIYIDICSCLLGAVCHEVDRTKSIINVVLVNGLAGVAVVLF